jgi:hypothetical protein
VPLVKWHRGEQTAFVNLANSVRKRITPIFEVEETPIGDYATGALRRTHEAQLTNAVEAIESCWGKGLCFVDVRYLEDEAVGHGTGAQHFYSQLSSRSLQFVPVVATTTSGSAMAAANANSTLGIALRLSQDDFQPTPTAIAAVITALEARLGVERGKVDIIIDLADVVNNTSAALNSIAWSFVNAIPNINEWRTVTLLASAFPYTVSSLLSPSSTGYAARTEWIVWRSLYLHHLAGTSGLSRMPSFGDYGIQNPTEVDFDPRYMTVSAQIRYTLSTQWYIARGLSLRGNGGGQYTAMAAALTASPDFMGVAHCWGCAQADGCGNGTVAAGSPEKWRSIGTCHHLSLTADDVTGLP